MKKWWVKSLAVLGLLLVVFCAMLLMSSVHNKSDLEKYKAQLRAAGEKLNVMELAPPLPPPEKNGADLFDQASRYINSAAGAFESNEPPMMRMVAPGKAIIGWQQAEIIAAYKQGTITNSWEDMDQAVQAQGAAFDLLRQAAERPQLNFDVDYSAFPNLTLSNLSRIKGAGLVLSYAIMCELHRGDTASATTNLDTSLKLVNEWQDEPLLISQLVRITMTSLAASAQWELLRATNLTDPQLAMLQRDWETVKFVQPMQQAMAMERDESCAMIEHLRGSNSPSALISGTSGGSSAGFLDIFKPMVESAKRDAVDTLWRFSWSYDDELSVLREEQTVVDAVHEAETNCFFNAIADLDRRAANLGTNRIGNDWFRNTLDKDIRAEFMDSAGALSGSLKRTMGMEVTRAIVITAIALKRYQLRHGSLPTDLNTLVPGFLHEVPRDPVDGKPLRYKPGPDGSYLLYSVGNDGKDDGGAVSPNSIASFNWQRARDWVWPQPATAAEVQKYYDNLPK